MNEVLDQIKQVCEKIRQQDQEPVSFKKLIAFTKQSFKKFVVQVQIKTYKKCYLNQNQFYIEGYYFFQNSQLDQSFIKLLVYHNFDTDSQLQKKQITEFLIQVYDTVAHEMRHHMQYQKKICNLTYFSAKEYTSYLAEPDEVDAYALSISIELLRSMSKQRAIVGLRQIIKLSKTKSRKVFVSPSLNSYINNFKKNPLIKKIAKKVYKNILSLDNICIFK